MSQRITVVPAVRGPTADAAGRRRRSRAARSRRGPWRSAITLNSSPISCSLSEPRRVGARAQRRPLHQLGDAAVEEEARLRGVAGDVEAGVLAGERDAGEIDMRGDVLDADVGERVGVGAMPAVAHQGALRRAAGGSTRPPESRSRRRTPRRARAARPGWRRRPRPGHGSRSSCPAGKRGSVRRPQRRRPVGRRRTPLAVAAADAALEPGRAVEVQQIAPASRRAPRCRSTTPFIRSGSASSQRDDAGVAARRRALALAQRRRQLDDRVAPRCAAPSAASSSAASAPEPAPNSHTSSLPERVQRLGHLARASARPNSGDSSGAVTKSLPLSGMRPTTVRPLA